MKTLHYTLVDVFTNKPFGGNQLAVFHGTTMLNEETMQKIARELNLSETVFILPPNNNDKIARLKIFTPKVELPMAGHPTIGAAYVLAKTNIIETIEGENQWIFEEGIGDVPVTVWKKDGQITKVEMEQPLPNFGDKFVDTQMAAKLLSLSVKELHTTLPIQTVSSGVPFLFIPVSSISSIKNIRFRTDIWDQYFSTNQNTMHIFTFSLETEAPHSSVHSRMFAPAMGIAEDPATGAASGPLGAYLVKYGAIQAIDQENYFIRSEQGFEIQRPSHIDISIHANPDIKRVKVGGKSVIIGSGQLSV
ncbi:PhzF family phenazine biosynthesis protein [Bacillus spongiae]|uniref:PhzF family phenazine biosynthesis protein n=1 Tax=Bacillus spongiae TaxID=2683610 RepID=A0ABU8HEC2_9BACI